MKRERLVEAAESWLEYGVKPKYCSCGSPMKLCQVVEKNWMGSYYVCLKCDITTLEV